MPKAVVCFSPILTGAGLVFVQSKLKRTSVGAIEEVGVKAKTKLCAAPGPMFAGVCWKPREEFMQQISEERASYQKLFNPTLQ